MPSVNRAASLLIAVLVMVLPCRADERKIYHANTGDILLFARRLMVTTPGGGGFFRVGEKGTPVIYLRDAESTDMAHIGWNGISAKWHVVVEVAGREIVIEAKNLNYTRRQSEARELYERTAAQWAVESNRSGKRASTLMALEPLQPGEAIQDEVDALRDRVQDLEGVIDRAGISP